MALLAVAVFFVCFFPHVLFGNRFIIAGDAFYYSYPLRTIAWRMVGHGELPVWTPHVLSGYPLLAMSQLGLAYPLTWGYLFFPGPWAEQLYVLAPFMLTPVFTYAYARQIGRSRLASLLAGLTFGYGGMMCGFIANSGLLTNTLMWTPLVLLFIDRARESGFPHCVFWATLAYAMSVLAGHAQSYVSVGALALAYGLFLSLASVFQRRGQRPLLTDCRPLLVATCAVVLSAGVAAFQLLEVMSAARRSIRSALSYGSFAEGSFTLREALLSIVAPLYHYIDTSGYVAPLALLLAAIAVVLAVRGRRANKRLWFWLAVAFVGFVLMLGAHTPFYRLVYRIPVLNGFRVPSRHTFEWTLAVSILAGYGWDGVADHLAKRQEGRTRHYELELVVTVLLLTAGIVVAGLWYRATSQPPLPKASIYTGLSERHYWFWKLAFTVLIFVAIWRCFQLSRSSWRTSLLTATVMLACFAEPLATVSCWWLRMLSLPESRLQLVSPTTRYLQQFPASENRVYSRVGLFSEEFNPQPRLEAPNLTAVFDLQNVAGMEPLIFERYSRALGNVGPDSVTPLAEPSSNYEVFNSRSHVLDLLNTTHVVSFTNLKPFEDELILREGIGVAAADLDIALPPGASVQLPAFGDSTTDIALVSSLANSVNVEDGTPVARLRLHISDGQTREWFLRAGRETSEWAHERADVKPVIKHRLAPVFDQRPGDATNSFSACRYWTRFTVNPRQQVNGVEITNVTQASTLALWKVTLHDSLIGHSAPLTQNPARLALENTRWQTAFESAGVFVLQNLRALPRAWLVSEAEAVDGEEALRRIQGESSHQFDPRRTALLEAKPNELPELPGGELTPESQARITSYEPGRVQIETNAPKATVLVVSEIFYPSWQAKVDGQPALILLTDYLLRGVSLPPGQHRVEMRYAAPAARAGVIISGCAVALLSALFFYQRRRVPPKSAGDAPR
jgi:Bacterial membrane protein YfhO